MPKIISIHDYVLKPTVDVRKFEAAIRSSQARGLFHLPGLIAYHFVKGIKGTQQGQYTAIWIYDSREAWERVWGSLESPHSKPDYPQSWQVWEDEILAPFLTQDADTITFTAYEELP